MMQQFIASYGLPILGAALTAFAGWLGVQIKKIYEKHVNTKVKRDVVHIAVTGVEQIYKDLHGDEKLQKALEAASEMLGDKGITVSSFELRMMIESAVKEMNKAFSEPEKENAEGGDAE